ncbi:translocation/assembly module TamB domain-containing protein [Comamonas thiooxydans]|uniref:Translocation/assembly module TamB domain-containing protein n=1 Tax=Comamonas thiooxydans TaxID=363952 RepID=A0AA42TWS7_9BURK|nr:translocation/assembly module TamB domain-containing protein [Comamonas thiooxydans]MDH1336708.1 translocation/assembly module TamB domain-containing protein [Comamonas thiooxydans]MDH1742886.1 translocation/assembly module TamB domain-containing protein [Comamonas thiooxydans]MDH1789233.1 translocation/assembly module TamB domain-containing protein [Comamonas thiooxydans]
MAEQDTTPTAKASSSAPRRRRWLRALGWTIAAALLALALALGSLLWWIGRDDSLNQTLQRVAGWLPADQSLVAKEVTGSVKNGGRIGWLQWQSPTMKVEVREAQIGWQFRPLLLSRTLKLGEIHIAELRIASTPDPDQPASEPLQSLTLPVKIELPFRIDQIIWQGPPEAVVQDLHGRYEYTGTDHELKVSSLRFAQGAYQAQLKLQGAAPMALQAEATGDVQVPNPLDKSADALNTIAVQAKVTAEGTLATEAARLAIKANASAEASTPGPVTQDPQATEPKREKSGRPSEAATAEVGTMQADVEASIMPWRSQPLLAAKARLHNLDVSAFWPQGPRTLLTGQLQAGPDETVAPATNLEAQPWNLNTRFSNALPGPWDKQRLPVAELTARIDFDGQQWQVDDSRIQIGKGHIALGGQFTPSTRLFEGLATVEQLNPADLYSTLEASPLQGRISAKAVQADVDSSDPAASKIVFDASLQAAGGKRDSRALRIQTLAASGQWQAPLLQLEKLQLQALQASVDARSVEFNTETQQAKAQLKAVAPGAQLSIEGQMGPASGAVQSQLQLGSMSTLTQWLRKLPGVKDPLSGAQLDGSADLQLALKGGWENLLKRMSAAHGAAIPASGLQIQAKLRAEKIRYLPAGTAAEQSAVLPALALSIDGSPENARVGLTAQAQQAGKSIQLDTTLQAGLTGGKAMAPLDWQASLEKLQAQFTPDKNKPGPWVVQLQPGAPVQIQQRTSGSTVLSTAYQFSAGKLQITPPKLSLRRTSSEPLPPAQLTWEASSVTRAGSGQWGVRSAGQALGIPLAWVDAFSLGDDDPPLEAAGISGDLSFNARWNLDTLGKDLKADLTVERAAGDLRLAVDDGSSTTVIQTTGPTATRAGGTRTRQIGGAGMRSRIKDMRLNVQAQGSQVNAKLLWDSERAGKLNADLRTQLSYQQDGWTLPATAPLSGQLHANMPDMGLWSLFAPPGWRIQGSLAADASISGTLQDPKWQGDIKADGLNIVSLLDGVDLRDGILRAKLQGTRLDITELRLKGGKGSQARILGYSGNLTRAPEDGGQLTGSGYAQFTPPGTGAESGLSMNLQAKASKLQVLVRADRQVSVSGDLQARLEQGQFTLRGDLTVDRASIILPEESAPSLDKDVVVRSAASRKAEEEERRRSEQQARKEQARATPRKVPDILVKLDMGRDFALQGFGITTRLLGQLEVRGASYIGGPPSVTGEIRTEQGRYRAWGQSLNVETGLIRFNGPYNNPSLDILALRPNIAVKAGVQVLGTASAPRVLLYSDPALPDAEKLSWVVMGRDPASGGASSALLQQAAMALLAGGNSSSGKIAGSLGLDEVGFKGGGDGTDAAGAALTMGKRISDKLYLTYEQSLSGAMGIIYIFYDLSRSVTLRAQTGMTSAMDIVYTVRKD